MEGKQCSFHQQACAAFSLSGVSFAFLPLWFLDYIIILFAAWNSYLICDKEGWARCGFTSVVDVVSYCSLKKGNIHLRFLFLFNFFLRGNVSDFLASILWFFNQISPLQKHCQFLSISTQGPIILHGSKMPSICRENSMVCGTAQVTW